MEVLVSQSATPTPDWIGGQGKEKDTGPAGPGRECAIFDRVARSLHLPRTRVLSTLYRLSPQDRGGGDSGKTKPDTGRLNVLLLFENERNPTETITTTETAHPAQTDTVENATGIEDCRSQGRL